MSAVIHFEEREVIDVHYLPAVSIVHPFEPMMSSKSELEFELKQAVEKVKSRLIEEYAVDKVWPVVLRLNGVIQNLNYNTQKKSVAIFVSPVTEQVYYLNIPVEERIVIDETFEIRDVIYSKKQNIEYLVLMLSGERSKMYVAKNSKFTLIKSNVPDNLVTDEINIDEKEKRLSDPGRGKEQFPDKFLHQMDEDLKLILDAYKLPVFAVGDENILERFKKITKNTEKLLGFIPGNYLDASEKEMNKIFQPYIQDWKMVKQQNILQEIGKAVDYERVSFGMQNVWEAANHKSCRLLVVEKDFVHPVQAGDKINKIFPEDIKGDNPFYIKDAVDNVIEKVLQSGGDVEFIENGMLKDYGRIALIQYY
ncbi:MAG TPA: hypothetical protein VH396_17250 [Chitinophagaceae bacterium]|jgi:hypothetical protein